MTAATIHRPAHLPTQLPSQRTSPVRPSPRPVLELVPPLAPAAVDREIVRPVQLTRRGRVVLLLVFVAVGVTLMMALSGLVGGAAAGTSPSRPVTRTVVVQPGQTLWSIAGEVAPGVDRRDTIARIVELNALPSTDVSAGARIAVPTR
jgi:hypothetical protein